MRFSNKVVGITGGSQGLGRVIADRFEQEGAYVSIADCQLPEEWEPSERRRLHRCDVTRESDVASWVHKTIEDFGHFDILVNSAGPCPAPRSRRSKSLIGTRSLQ